MFLTYFDDLCLFLVFLGGLSVFVSMRNHLLLTLLSLEYLVLCVYMVIINYIMMYFGDMYFVLVFLTFSVCEGVLGLSVLVTLIRSHGNDHVNTLFPLSW